MFFLSDESRRSIQDSTGLSVEQIADMDFEEIDTKISHKLGRKVSGYIKDDALLGRGQVYLAENRFISAAEVERGLATHDRRKSAFVGRCI
jgi:hypothetical protein